jgi:hypothetical protein
LVLLDGMVAEPEKAFLLPGMRLKAVTRATLWIFDSLQRFFERHIR